MDDKRELDLDISVVQSQARSAGTRNKFTLFIGLVLTSLLVGLLYLSNR